VRREAANRVTINCWYQKGGVPTHATPVGSRPWAVGVCCVCVCVQVEGTVSVSWAQPRVLGLAQIGELRGRLDVWLDKVSGLWKPLLHFKDPIESPIGF
jgi:hypothetical protein